ncbi:MAG: hypothetical protein HXX17_05185 [Geobacteraceae bacterium]|nr:hypothetical protein [Geobacteraceae bacterium]
MSEKVSIRLPAALAYYVKPETDPVEKMKAITSRVAASPDERAALLFFLCYDKNPEVKVAALAELKTMPLTLAEKLYASHKTHPKLKELFAKFYPSLIAVSPLTAPEAELLVAPVAEPEAFAEPEEEQAPEEGKEPEQEEFRSKYQLAQSMGVGEKIKMALTGDKEWRSILVKDSNKLVNSAVVKNPRITDPEILAISKSAIQNEEILRIICHNKEWVKNYEIRKALVLNNKTPLPVALRFMGFLTEKDLAGMAKSKNISSVLANNARRALSAKKKS